MLSAQLVLNTYVFNELMEKGEQKGSEYSPQCHSYLLASFLGVSKPSGSGDTFFPLQEVTGPSAKLGFLFSAKGG